MNSLNKIIRRGRNAVRWRLGLPVAAPELQQGTDEAIRGFYNSRVTHCDFGIDPNHYEWPRFAWVIDQVSGGALLEVGCGNGGMTQYLSPKVEQLTAFDISGSSLAQLAERKLPNVECVEGLIERYQALRKYDWIVMSEVIEHTRKPGDVIAHCTTLLAPGGTLVMTTPNGHWESDEHLHEYTLEEFSRLLAKSGAESFRASYLRDNKNCRRWLTGLVTASLNAPAPDLFQDRSAIAWLRRQKGREA